MVSSKNKHSKTNADIADVAETQDITVDDELQKRKGKKRDARASAAKADSVTEAVAALEMPASTAAGADEAPPVDTRIIFVGGVRFVSADEIRNHFKQFGEILDVTYPVSTKNNTKRPLGCAFLTFKKKKDAAKALSLDGTMLCEKTIRVQIKLPEGFKGAEKERAPRKRKKKNGMGSRERARKKLIEKAASKEGEKQADSKDGDANKDKSVKRKVEKSEDAVEDTKDGEAKKCKKVKKVEKTEDAVADTEDDDAKQAKKAKRKE